MNVTSTRTCPVCSSGLEPITHEGVELDRCPSGHGVWLDRGELRAVVASEQAPRPQDEIEAVHTASLSDAGHSVVAEVDRPSRGCPVCARAMVLTEYAASGIAIDECPDHGVWLDGDELARIEAYAEGVRQMSRGGAPAAARHQIAGIDVPAEILATINTLGSPPPG